MCWEYALFPISSEFLILFHCGPFKTFVWADWVITLNKAGTEEIKKKIF